MIIINLIVIELRFLFHALDRFWHHGCLKCSCCGARLADMGVSCYTKAGMILCRTDYVRYCPLHSVESTKSGSATLLRPYRSSCPLQPGC